MHGFVIVNEQEEALAIIHSDKDLCEIIDFDLHQKSVNLTLCWDR